MANIPEPGLPDVAPQPLPTPYQSTAGVTPDAFGAAAGRSLDRVGGVAHDLYQQERQYADTAAVLGAEAQAKGALNKIILDDQTGYRSLRGADAVAGRDDALQKFQKAVTDAGSTLTSDRQRQHFEGLAQTIREEGFRWAIHHDVTEQEHLAIANFRGNVDQTMVTMENPAIVSDKVSLGKQIDSLFQTGIEEARRRYGQGASRDAIASVVVPELQKAAVGGMEAAVATQDPAVAKAAFDQLGKYMITNHQRFYAGVVEKLATRASVDGNAGAVLRYAAESVPVPGGDPVMRIDGTKLAAALAALPSDSPHLAEIQKAIETRQVLLDKVWTQNVAQVVSRVQSAGTDPATGAFSLSAPAVTTADRLWLQQYAPDKLIALRGQDARAQRQDNLADRQISAGNYNNLIAKMIDPTARKQVFGPQTPEEFKSALLDEAAYPGGFTDQDTKRALQAFVKLKQDVGKLQEPVPTAVREILGAAFPNTPIKAKDYVGPLHDALQAFVDREKAAHNGVAPDQATVRKYGEQELAKGSVTAAGTPDAWYNRMNVRRIEFQTKPEYGGKQFNPKEGGAPEVRGALVERKFTRGPDGKLVEVK